MYINSIDGPLQNLQLGMQLCFHLTLFHEHSSTSLQSLHDTSFFLGSDFVTVFHVV